MQYLLTSANTLFKVSGSRGAGALQQGPDGPAPSNRCIGGIGHGEVFIVAVCQHKLSPAAQALPQPSMIRILTASAEQVACDKASSSVLNALLQVEEALQHWLTLELRFKVGSVYSCC